MYVDTSALARVLLGEPDAPAVVRELERFDRSVSSGLLRIELRRVGLRSDRLGDVDQLLAGMALIPMADELLSLAETIEPADVGALDAIHLATAVRLAAGVRLDAVMTYDRQLAEGARHHGLKVLAPA